ncbi:MAG: hypothetical protein LH477_10000 [Nocardioides sp.]|nr:hypothetical protein [Nocardioides sp.]
MRLPRAVTALPVSLSVSLALSALALSACSTEAEMQAVDPAAQEPGSADTPSASGEAPAPVPEGAVTTNGLVTVLDPGTGPQLCLGAIAESYPPQCSGLPLEDFDFGDVGAEEASGVTWGSYAVTGTFDGTTFTATQSIPAALYDPMAMPTEEPPGPACESPTTTDAAKATPEAMDATLTAASALPGLAMTWLSGNTINVAVTEDAAGAEALLRETWGGPLCVVTAERTEAELNTISQELQAALPTLLTSGSMAADSIDAQVVFDDGSIQAWADETYGEGLVQVSSALVPTEG